jgi:DHA1 family purine ribonucleoside efflux pump-like MFS transporter
MTDIAESRRARASAPPVPLDGEGAREKPREAWAAIVSLSLGVFGLVTAEFLPASLLTRIADDLQISDGSAGQAVTATAVVAAVAGPVIVIGTGRMDRRAVMWGLSLLLVLSNLLAAIAWNLPLLLLARTVLGVALGGFWSLAAAVALRLVPMDKMPRAMSIVFTGVSVATVCAAPLGAYLGEIWGWRATFLLTAAIGGVALVVQLLTIPRLPAVDAPGLGTMLLVLRRRSIRLGLIVVLLAVSGHFAGFTYVRPFLEQVPKLSITLISSVLLAFGIGGFFGNLVGGFITAKSTRAGVAFASLLLGASGLALVAFGDQPNLAAIATALWGFAFGAFPVGVQTWTTRAATDHAESAGALLLIAFQVAIASGAIIGGLLVDGWGPQGAILYCGILALAGGVVMLVGSQRAA